MEVSCDDASMLEVEGCDRFVCVFFYNTTRRALNLHIRVKIETISLFNQNQVRPQPTMQPVLVASSKSIQFGRNPIILFPSYLRIYPIYEINYLTYSPLASLTHISLSLRHTSAANSSNQH